MHLINIILVEKRKMKKLCKCGCRQSVRKPTSIYIFNHHHRGVKRPQTKEHTEKIRQANIGKKRSKETKKI